MYDTARRVVSKGRYGESCFLYLGEGGSIGYVGRVCGGGVRVCVMVGRVRVGDVEVWELCKTLFLLALMCGGGCSVVLLFFIVDEWSSSENLTLSRQDVLTNVSFMPLLDYKGISYAIFGFR